jgi:hypothetical protein
MPVEKRWYEFSRENVLEMPKDMLGIYFLGDKDKTPVYIGSSKRSDIRARLMAHLRNKRCPKAKYFKYEVAGTFDEPTQMESRAILLHVRKYKKFPIYIKAYPRLTKLT